MQCILQQVDCRRDMVEISVQESLFWTCYMNDVVPFLTKPTRKREGAFTVSTCAQSGAGFWPSSIWMGNYELVIEAGDVPFSAHLFIGVGSLSVKICASQN